MVSNGRDEGGGGLGAVELGLHARAMFLLRLD